MKKLLKLLVITALSLLCVNFAQADNRLHNHNNWGLSISGPGYGLSINSGHGYPSGFYFGIPIRQPMMYPLQPIIRQPIMVPVTSCDPNVYVGQDQFGNTVLYRNCWANMIWQ